MHPACAGLTRNKKMKLNASQLSVLRNVAANKKATYSQAVVAGGNGKTVQTLVERGLLAVNAPKKATDVTTYSITAAGKAALKAADKAAPKATV